MSSKTIVITSDILSVYGINDVDDSGAVKYYGYSRPDGSWYIQKEDTGTYRYAKGSDGYDVNWSNRAALSYDYFHNTFA